MITAEGQRDKYMTHLSNGTAGIQADAAKDKGGSGNHFRPHDLICAGYASCLNMTVRRVLDEMSLKYEKVITEVDLKRGDDRSTFLYSIEIVGDMDAATKELVISKAIHCPVEKTLLKSLRFERADSTSRPFGCDR